MHQQLVQTCTSTHAASISRTQIIPPPSESLPESFSDHHAGFLPSSVMQQRHCFDPVQHRGGLPCGLVGAHWLAVLPSVTRAIPPIRSSASGRCSCQVELMLSSSFSSSPPCNRRQLAVRLEGPVDWMRLGALVLSVALYVQRAATQQAAGNIVASWWGCSGAWQAAANSQGLRHHNSHSCIGMTGPDSGKRAILPCNQTSVHAYVQRLTQGAFSTTVHGFRC